MKDERSDIEDQLLVMDAQDGDATAMEKLVRRWQRRLWQHAFRLTDDAKTKDKPRNKTPGASHR